MPNQKEIMRKYLYIISIIFFIVSCNKEVKNFKPTTKLENILKDGNLNKTFYEFRLKNVFLTRGIDTTKSFKTFVKNTNFKELINLTECEKPLIRCFAFKALIEKKYPNIRSLLFRHKNDKESIEVINQCVRLNESVNFYMLSQLDPFAKTKYRFNKKEFDEVRRDFIGD